MVDVSPTLQAMGDFLHEWADGGAPKLQTPPATLYHYTDAEALDSMLRSKTLRASHTAFLNDSSEIKYALGLLDSIVKETGGNAGDPSEAADQVILAAAHELLSYVEIYAVCFCENGDLLSQWRGYGHGGGYAVGFKGDNLHVKDRSLPSLVKVHYDPAEHRRLLVDLVVRWRTAPKDLPLADNDRPAHNLARLIFAVAFAEVIAGLKHPSFAEEQEWRLVYRRTSKETPDGRVLDDGLDLKREFRPRGGVLLPYVSLTGKPERIKEIEAQEIMVGPTSDPVLAAYPGFRS